MSYEALIATSKGSTLREAVDLYASTVWGERKIDLRPEVGFEMDGVLHRASRDGDDWSFYRTCLPPLSQTRFVTFEKEKSE